MGGTWSVSSECAAVKQRETERLFLLIEMISFHAKFSLGSPWAPAVGPCVMRNPDYFAMARTGFIRLLQSQLVDSDECIALVIE
jgi:hypothetical protein